jgi:hypothetical protein
MAAKPRIRQSKTDLGVAAIGAFEPSGRGHPNAYSCPEAALQYLFDSLSGQPFLPARADDNSPPSCIGSCVLLRDVFASPFHAFVIVRLVRTVRLNSLPHSPNNGTSGGAFPGITADYRGAGCTARRSRRSACSGRRLLSIGFALIGFRLRHCTVRRCRDTQDQQNCADSGTDAHHGFVLVWSASMIDAPAQSEH